MNKHSAKVLFGHKPFLFYFLACASSELAYQVAFVALGWYLYSLTHSAVDLGMIGLIQFLPSVLFVFVIGHAADRFDRRKLLQCCQLVQGLVAVYLTLGSVMDWLSVTHIFVCVGLLGVSMAFEGPGAQALLPSVIPQSPDKAPSSGMPESSHALEQTSSRPDDNSPLHPNEPSIENKSLITQATTLGSSIYQMGAVAGPALGGVAYALNTHAPFFLMSALWFAAAFFSSQINTPRRQSHSPPSSSSTSEDLSKQALSDVDRESVFAGARFVWDNPFLLGILSLDLFAVLLGGATTLLPIYAKDILDCGAGGLGLLRSAPALGALLMTAYLSRFSLGQRVGLKMFYSVILFGLCTVVFALSSTMWLSLTALVLMGAVDMVSVIIRSSLVQIATPEQMRGRVSAINFLFINASNQLGGFESGITAALFGVVGAAALGGVGTIAVALIWMKLFPSIIRINSLD